MKISQLSPYLAQWIEENFNIKSLPVRELNLKEASDKEIFFSAKKENAVVLTKDIDFCRLLDQYGSPPQIIWLTCGNTSNKKLKEILSKNFPAILKLLKANKELIEIS